ncbi:unnamed protein product [Caenorhabditis sp. 36 PRJEB53466]|nr:unnamed protein product [Caenorhabditis sp. 36 PRJEB53466]
MPSFFPLLLLIVAFAPAYSLPTVSPQWNLFEPKVPELVITPDYNIPQVEDAPEIPYDERDSPTHAYGVDVAFHTFLSDMDCLRDQGYKTVFVRAFNPIGNGYFDREALNTINNAYDAGIGSEVYITPNINSSRSGADQVSLVYQNLYNNGVNVKSIWIQVTSPSNWKGTLVERIEFIQEMVQRVQDLGLTAGIYTSFYDWLEITGGWNTLSSDVLLWYWHVLGVGARGETEPILDDFRPFGPWRSAAVKQFAQVEKVSSVSSTGIWSRGEGEDSSWIGGRGGGFSGFGRGGGGARAGVGRGGGRASIHGSSHYYGGVRSGAMGWKTGSSSPSESYGSNSFRSTLFSREPHISRPIFSSSATHPFMILSIARPIQYDNRYYYWSSAYAQENLSPLEFPILCEYKFGDDDGQLLNVTFQNGTSAQSIYFGCSGEMIECCGMYCCHAIRDYIKLIVLFIILLMLIPFCYCCSKKDESCVRNVDESSNGRNVRDIPLVKLSGEREKLQTIS